MEVIFFVCALVGGTVMVCQFLMTVLGLGGDADLADDVGGGDLHANGDFGGDASDLGGDVPGDSGPGGDLTDVLERPHHGGEHQHHGSNWFFVKLTFQTIVAAVAFFGLGGMAAASGGMPRWASVVVAIVAGLAALYVVYWLMELLHRFNSDGNVKIANAVGRTGTVYVSIPSENSGAGKIMLNLQNRTVELQARTREPQRLAPGATIVVLKVLEPGLVEVGLAPERAPLQNSNA